MGLKYLLDTNVLSEFTKAAPNSNVLSKLAETSGQFCTCVTVWHEMQFGIERLKESKRKLGLLSFLEALETSGLPVLAYEKPAAIWLARQRAKLANHGLTPALADGEIAAVAAHHQLILVTRNTDDFRVFEGLIVENWFAP